MNKINNNKRLVVISASVISFLILICIVYLTFVRKTGAEYAITREVSYSFTISNTTNKLINDVQFLTHAPVSKTSIQHVEEITASHQYDMISDDLGNQVLKFTFSEFPPFATKIINIRAKLSLAETPNKNKIRDKSRYLKSEKYIEVEDQVITETASLLHKSSIQDTAKNIYDWVVNNINYAGYVAETHGAQYAITNKTGDCTEYMYLYIALCRANKITARGVAGYVCRENTILKATDYHNWAEFYDKGAWYPVDVQSKSFLQDMPSFISMRIISDENNETQFDRFKIKGEGLIVKMN